MCKDGKPIYADNTCDISVSGSVNTYEKNVLSPWCIKAKNRQFPHMKYFEDFPILI